MTAAPEEAPGVARAPSFSHTGAVVLRPAVLPLAMAVLLLCAATALALLAGPVRVPPGAVGSILLAHLTGIHLGTWPAEADQIVWQIRAPRVLLAGMVGATLATTGAAYQGVFRNPLAEPYLIGVAAGAGLGATIVLVSPLSGAWHGLSLVTPAAFLGAMAAVLVAVAVSRATRLTYGAGLVLAGVAVAAMGNALTSFLLTMHNTRLASVFAWLMGGFTASTWSRAGLLALYALPCLFILVMHARLLNVLLLDDEQARYLGVHVERVRLIVLVAASLAAAAAVSVSGLIGFVGLIVPHIARRIVGPDHRRLLPLVLVGGATLLILADLVARTAVAPSEMPVGIVTAFLGGPFFLYLLWRGRRVTW
jgi:iron complex transport system permease protein